MHPGDVQTCLQEMTQIEEMLIAQTYPIMSVYRKHGGQWGYKGHVLNLPHGFLQTLPCSVLFLTSMFTALQWLKPNNPCLLRYYD